LHVDKMLNGEINQYSNFGLSLRLPHDRGPVNVILKPGSSSDV